MTNETNSEPQKLKTRSRRRKTLRYHLGVLASQLLFGLAGVCGLVLAAAVSALPSASCAAMARAYTDAIGTFGILGLVTAFFGLWGMIRNHMPGLRQGVLGGFGGAGSLIGGGTFFFYIAFSAMLNVSRATVHCTIGSPVDVASHQHDIIPLVGMRSWAEPLARRIMGGPTPDQHANVAKEIGNAQQCETRKSPPKAN